MGFFSTLVSFFNDLWIFDFERKLSSVFCLFVIVELLRLGVYKISQFEMTYDRLLEKNLIFPLRLAGPRMTWPEAVTPKQCQKQTSKFFRK